jgi:hypothetical protein
MSQNVIQMKKLEYLHFNHKCISIIKYYAPKTARVPMEIETAEAFKNLLFVVQGSADP